MTLRGMNFLNYSAMKFVKCLLFALSLCSLVALTGCDLPFKLPFDLPFGKEDPVVVSVGKVNLTQSKLLSMVPNWNSLDDRTRLAFLEHWIDEEVAYQEAMDAGIMSDSVLSGQIESTMRKLVVDYYLQTFADTMLIGDAEKLSYYQEHRENYLRGKTSISGAILYFKTWANADAYYKEMKSRALNVVPAENPLISEIVKFDTVTASPDTCMIKEIETFPIGKLSVMRYCGGALKMAIVTERLDSAEVRPYKDVAEDVSNMVWLEHRNTVMERLKKEWKMKRPIFSKSTVFSEKESE